MHSPLSSGCAWVLVLRIVRVLRYTGERQRNQPLCKRGDSSTIVGYATADALADSTADTQRLVGGRDGRRLSTLPPCCTERNPEPSRMGKHTGAAA